MYISMKKVLNSVAMTMALSAALPAVEVVVLPSEGAELILDMDTHETMGDLALQLESLDGDHANWVLVATRGNRSNYRGSPQADAGYSRDSNAGARDYYYTPTQQDMNNIHTLITTLADKNEAYLLFNKGSIEDAGKATEHIHPLRLLQIIFTNEELKVGIRNMSNRRWVWDSFRQGTADSLADEARVNNMPTSYLAAFVAAVDIDINHVLGQYTNGQWRDFIDTLVKKVPRKGDHRRYDF